MELILKLIIYYHSNTLVELRFFSKENKSNSFNLSKNNINSIVNEALVGVDNDDNDDDEAKIQRTINNDIIPNNEVII